MWPPILTSTITYTLIDVPLLNTRLVDVPLFQIPLVEISLVDVLVVVAMHAWCLDRVCLWRSLSSSAGMERLAVLLFSKLNKIFFGYFHPDFFFKIMKINNFQGDLTDISAKNEALALGAPGGGSDNQRCRFSRNIAQVTPIIILVYYLKTYIVIQDQSIQK